MILDAFMKKECGKPKCAFTLAEVLITLGIIGVVAAVTLPTVIGNYQKQETTARLKRALTVINQALQRSRLDNEEIEYWQSYKEIGLIPYVEKYWSPYFQSATICRTYDGCRYSSNKPYKNPNGSNAGHTVVVLTGNNQRLPILTYDGIMFTFAPEAYGMYQIPVDINGPAGPNKIGRDYFFFVYDPTKKSIIPIYNDATEEQLSAWCSGTNGNACAAKILRDNWTIKDDYPW